MSHTKQRDTLKFTTECDTMSCCTKQRGTLSRTTQRGAVTHATQRALSRRTAHAMSRCTTQRDTMPRTTRRNTPAAWKNVTPHNLACQTGVKRSATHTTLCSVAQNVTNTTHTDVNVAQNKSMPENAAWHNVTSCAARGNIIGIVQRSNASR